MSTVLLVLLNLVIVSLSQLPPSPPPFSWNTIPLFFHASNSSGALNKTAAKYMSTFPITTIANGQGGSYKWEEDRIIAALQQIRSYNSSVRTMFYLNAMWNFHNYELSQNFTGSNEKYLLHDSNGKLAHGCNKNFESLNVFDLTYNFTQTLWLNTVNYAMSKISGVTDGIFIDTGTDNLSNRLDCINLTQAKCNEWDNAHSLMIQKTMELVYSINKERGIIICNGEDIPTANARMFENMRNSNPSNNDMTTFMKENGIRISEVHDDGCTPYSQKYNQSLTIYLIGAYKYSYYGCSEGYSTQNNGWDTIWENKDYQKPLGQPLMNATYNKNTKVYYREFEKGVKVWLDDEWKYPCIKWSDGSITGTTQSCNKY